MFKRGGYNTPMDDDGRFMLLAIELAGRGRGSVEPNPMVGAVIVRGGRRLGCGWHKRFGGPHAEIEALGDAARSGRDIRGATMYVSLEPCCHRGKTPPCTDAIIDAGLGRVVVAMQDPHEKVAGGGIAALRAAGIDVLVGVCQAQARQLLTAYIKLRTERRPWVICKWAQTCDGLVELGEDQGKWISGAQSRSWVHKLRGRCEGICIGIGTVIADDPLLTNRSGLGRDPIRVVLDCGLGIPLDSQLVLSAGEVPLIVATSAEALTANPGRAEQLISAGVELLELPAAEGRLHLPALLDQLGRRGWTYLLVEGGPTVLEGFIDSDLADELLVFVSPPKDVPAPETLKRFDIAQLRRRMQLGEPQISRIGDDTLLRFVLSSY